MCPLEKIMRERSEEISRNACAYCGEPLPFNTIGVKAWRAGKRLFCNEFCADGDQVGTNSLEQSTSSTLP
jgi:hypothetical protein